MKGRQAAVLVLVLASALGCAAPEGSLPDRDPLPSWIDGPAKAAIVDFVTRVTDAGGPDHVPEAERVAVFDNDGTLWSEQPVYFQVAFVFEVIRALAPRHPEWREHPAFDAVIAGDYARAFARGGSLFDLTAAAGAGTVEELEERVREWIEDARHPRFQRPYTDLAFRPMLELLDYLRANGFETYIVSGGGLEFMRVWVEDVYGIPPENVIGTTMRVEYQVRDGEPTLVLLPEVEEINDKGRKAVNIHRHVGRRPIFAAGNSDGDFQMLEWTTAGTGPRFGMLVNHTDAEREWAYDRGSSIGRLERGLDEASRRGWLVVDMANDWRTVHAFSDPGDD